MVIDAPPEIQTIDLEVLLTTSPHLSVSGSYLEPLRIERNKEDSNRATFTVTVTEPDHEGPIGIKAQFIFRGRPCGYVRAAWLMPSREREALQETKGGIPLHVDSVVPDLTVILTAPAESLAFECSVCAPDVTGYESLTKPAPWNLKGETPQQFVRKRLQSFVTGAVAEDRRRELRKAGRAFWNAAPKSFQDALWGLIDARREAGEQGRPSLYIASDEPLLPWEVMLPSRLRPDGSAEDLPRPVGSEFAVGRWVHGRQEAPPSVIPISDSFLIAATYTGTGSSTPRPNWRCSASISTGSNSNTPHLTISTST